jgi:rhodanese-related sulfurtransferase
MSADRIRPEAAHELLEADASALLVCAYDDESKFEQNHLAGAISFAEFEGRADHLPPGTPIVCYCA